MLRMHPCHTVRHVSNEKTIALGEVVVEAQQREAIRLNALETPNMQKTVVTEKILPDRKIRGS